MGQGDWKIATSVKAADTNALIFVSIQVVNILIYAMYCCVEDLIACQNIFINQLTKIKSNVKNIQFCPMGNKILSVKNQKGVNAIWRYSVGNQKGAIGVQSLWQ